MRGVVTGVDLANGSDRTGITMSRILSISITLSAEPFYRGIRQVDRLLLRLSTFPQSVGEIGARLGVRFGKPSGLVRAQIKARDRSRRNQPSSPLQRWSRHHSTHNRRKNRHGRTGVKR